MTDSEGEVEGEESLPEEDPLDFFVTFDDDYPLAELGEEVVPHQGWHTPVQTGSGANAPEYIGAGENVPNAPFRAPYESGPTVEPDMLHQVNSPEAGSSRGPPLSSTAFPNVGSYHPMGSFIDQSSFSSEYPAAHNTQHPSGSNTEDLEYSHSLPQHIVHPGIANPPWPPWVTNYHSQMDFVQAQSLIRANPHFFGPHLPFQPDPSQEVYNPLALSQYPPSGPTGQSATEFYPSTMWNADMPEPSSYPAEPSLQSVFYAPQQQVPAGHPSAPSIPAYPEDESDEDVNLLSDDQFNAEINTGGYFNHFKTAKQSRRARYVDHTNAHPHDMTRPQTWQDDCRIVKRLALAIKNTRNTQDWDPQNPPPGKSPPAAWRNFRKGKYGDSQVQAVCWELLERCKAKHIQGKILPQWQRTKKGTEHKSFAGLIEELCYVLGKAKTVCKRLFDVPVAEDLVDNPVAQLKRAIQNKRLNRNKAQHILLGRAQLDLPSAKRKGKGKAREPEPEEEEEDEDEDLDEYDDDFTDLEFPDIEADDPEGQGGAFLGFPSVSPRPTRRRRSASEARPTGLRAQQPAPSPFAREETPTMPPRNSSMRQPRRSRRNIGLTNSPDSNLDPRLAQEGWIPADPNVLPPSTYIPPQPIPPQPEPPVIQGPTYAPGSLDAPIQDIDRYFFNFVQQRIHEDVVIHYGVPGTAIHQGRLVNAANFQDIYRRNWLEWPSFIRLQPLAPQTSQDTGSYGTYPPLGSGLDPSGQRVSRLGPSSSGFDQFASNFRTSPSPAATALQAQLDAELFRGGQSSAGPSIGGPSTAAPSTAARTREPRRRTSTKRRHDPTPDTDAPSSRRRKTE
ncbi:MAG: hypothetical protein M1833_001039 [Piccolia ochrophora]|nr:MAG: hypothetical protein M1833_001039 [Piccolia ochrophora]